MMQNLNINICLSDASSELLTCSPYLYKKRQ